jgi:restriction system protein
MLSPDARFSRLDAMSGPDFERALAELFDLLGYDVEQTPVYDNGADLVIAKDGERTAVQAKRSATSVGIAGVRQVLDGRYACTQALVVTNSFFTGPAIDCARAHDIDLWDRRVLADLLEGESPEVDATVCAECGAAVTIGTSAWCVDRPARYGGNVYCRKYQAKSRRRAA